MELIEMEKNQDDFLRTEVTFALVLRLDLESVQQVKEFLTEKDDIDVVYQTTDSGKLYITEDNPGGSD